MSGTGLATRDLTSRDFTFASVCTIAVFVVASFALRHARLEHHAELPTIDPGNAIPIAVRPVADIGPVGKKRGGAKPKAARKRKASSKRSEATPEPEVTPPDETAVPSAWQRKPRAPKEPTPTPLPDVAPPPTEPEQTPPPDPPDAEDNEVAPTDAPETPIDPDASPDGEGAGGEEAQTGKGSGESGEGVGGGGTQPGEGEGGGGDPLLDRAIAFYRARLVAWFASRFRVTGSGLSPEQLAKYRVRARIEIGEDLRIVGYKVLSSDHPTFEKAARTTLDGLRGETLPPPPENYPGAVQRQLTVSFTCTEDACD